MAALPRCSLARERLWINQLDEEEGEGFSQRSSPGLSWLTHGDHPSTLPPTSSPSHIHTFTHTHRHTVSLVNVNCLGLSVDWTISPHSQICFQQITSFRCYLKVKKKKVFSFVLSTVTERNFGLFFFLVFISWFGSNADRGFSSSFLFIVCDIQTQVTQQWLGGVGASKERVRGFSFNLHPFARKQGACQVCPGGSWEEWRTFIHIEQHF